MQMEALVHKWVGYAREMGEVRALQEKRAAAIQCNTEAMQALVQDAMQMKEEAEAKVSRWRRQCRRMEKDMTKLVHIKTRALEERKDIHEKYLELYQELQAQDDYAQKLEENEEMLKAKMRASSAEEVAAARQETEERVRQEMEEKLMDAREAEERVRLEMDEKLIDAQTAHEDVVAQACGLRDKIAALEAHAALAQAGAQDTATVAKGHLAEMEARAQEQAEKIGALTSDVAELRAATAQHDAIFEGTMLEMQAKEEKCEDLEAQLHTLSSELQAATKKLLQSETHNESEAASVQVCACVCVCVCARAEGIRRTRQRPIIVDVIFCHITIYNNITMVPFFFIFI
jgi:chromosome segregation ATPase